MKGCPSRFFEDDLSSRRTRPEAVVSATAEKNDVSRSEAIRRLVEIGPEAKGK